MSQVLENIVTAHYWDTLGQCAAIYSMISMCAVVCGRVYHTHRTPHTFYSGYAYQIKGLAMGHPKCAVAALPLRGSVRAREALARHAPKGEVGRIFWIINKGVRHDY